MNSFPSKRRLSAAAGIGAAIAMVAIGAGCADNAKDQPGQSGRGESSTNSPASSISSQLSSIISSVKPT